MYFVGSNGDAPDQLYFSLEDIDVFDAKGIKTGAYKLDIEKDEYTDSF